MNIWGITDTGVVREQNQDYYHIELLEENVGLAVVCDGMGCLLYTSDAADE